MKILYCGILMGKKERKKLIDAIFDPYLLAWKETKKKGASMYRIMFKSNYFALQKRRRWQWIWLDSTNVWCNWYGKMSPRIFNSMEEIKDFIFKDCVKKGEVIVQNFNLHKRVDRLEEMIKPVETKTKRRKRK